MRNTGSNNIENEGNGEHRCDERRDLYGVDEFDGVSVYRELEEARKRFHYCVAKHLVSDR